MTDLFATIPAKPDNAAFLADLAEGATTDDLRARFKAGQYGPIRPDFIKGWLKLAGRQTR